MVENSHVRLVDRALTGELLKASRSFAAVIVTGPRRSGKTTLLRRVFPHASYHLLEDPDTVSRLRADPRAFLDEVRLPTILDEIQNVPEIRPGVTAMPVDRFLSTFAPPAQRRAGRRTHAAMRS